MKLTADLIITPEERKYAFVCNEKIARTVIAAILYDIIGEEAELARQSLELLLTPGRDTAKRVLDILRNAYRIDGCYKLYNSLIAEWFPELSDRKLEPSKISAIIQGLPQALSDGLASPEIKELLDIIHRGHVETFGK